MIMNSLQARHKVRKSPAKRKKTQELPSTFNIKLFVSMGLLLVILLMKKYDLSIGYFNVDSIYNVVYHNEDLNAIKDRIFFFDTKKADETLAPTTDTTLSNSVEDSTDTETNLPVDTTTTDASKDTTQPSEATTDAPN